MCGRFGLYATPQLLAEHFALADVPAAVAPRYNLTPGQTVAVVREHDGRRRFDALQWGLVPFWAKDATIGRKLVNARLDTLPSKPAFREAWARRRCLVPASGFYEWSEPQASRKRPYFIRGSVSPVLALAGLWERWRTPAGQSLETCVIVTVEANALLRPIHDRMPLLVPPHAHAVWLDPRTTIAEATTFVAAAPELAAHAVGFGVNDPKNDNPALIAPVEGTLLG